MKIGYIDYVNCYPFYHGIFSHGQCSGHEIIPAYPGILNEMMRKGQLDLSPISSAAYADMQNSLFLLPQFCLSSEGYVRSVVLMSHVPIEELAGKKIGLTSASETSRVLLKILLEKYYDVKGEYEDVKPDAALEGYDALLLIGNEALKLPSEPVEYIYDIGDLWMRKTGHPVVFAVFAFQKSLNQQKKEALNEVIDCFEQSLVLFNNEKSQIINAAEKRYPDVDFNIGDYYDLLRYRFSAHLKDALVFYYEEAAALELLNPVEELNFSSEEVFNG